MVTALGSDVWWIDLGGVNAYLVDDDPLTLIDAGLPWQGGDVIEAVSAAGFSPSDLERILITHYDVDHVGGLGRLDAYGIEVYAGLGDAPLVAGDASPGFGSRKSAFQTLAGAFATDPRVPVTSLTDGESIGSFTVYETPGHTSGHVAYVSEDRDAAFVGDLVRESDGSLSPSPWVISEDTGQVRESIRSLADRMADVEILGFGHGVPFEGNGTERLRTLASSL